MSWKTLDTYVDLGYRNGYFKPYKLLVLDWNNLYHIGAYKQIIIEKAELKKKKEMNIENSYDYNPTLTNE